MTRVGPVEDWFKNVNRVIRYTEATYYNYLRELEGGVKRVDVFTPTIY